MKKQKMEMWMPHASYPDWQSMCHRNSFGPAFLHVLCVFAVTTKF